MTDMIDTIKNNVSKIKEQNKDDLIFKLSEENKDLKKQILCLTQKNKDLRRILMDNSTLKDKYSQAEKDFQTKLSERDNLIKQRDKQLVGVTRKLTELEKTMKLNKLDYDKNTVLYQQKMSIYNHIRQENEVYAEEVENIKKEKQEYKKQMDAEMTRFKVYSMLKYEKFKKSMDKDIEKINKDIININSEYIDSSHKLTLLQNKQLLSRIESLSKRVKEVDSMNKRLLQKLYEYENDIDIHKLVEKNLTQKCNGILSRNRSDIELNRDKNGSLKNSQFNSVRTPEQKKLLLSLSANSIMSKGKINERKSFEFKKALEKKDLEIERIMLINIQLKNKLNLYQKKYNGLFSFLEESLENFNNDEDLNKIPFFLENKEKIKNCDFNDFNPQEKNILLSNLMKHLLPIITINFNSTNIGKTFFKTSINNIYKGYNMNKTFLNDITLKNAFVDKKNQFFKDIMNLRKVELNPVAYAIKKKNNQLNYLEPKNQAVI